MKNQFSIHERRVRACSARRAMRSCLLLVVVVCGAGISTINAQSLSFDRERGRAMLASIKGTLKKEYYDPTLRGIDVEARFRQAEEEIKRATSVNEINGAIAQTLLDFGDSHTFFLPPAQTMHSEYGWQMRMVGANCYVVAVKPKSDAEAKGLKVGDRVHTVNGFKPTRDDLWKINYYFNALSPQTGLRLVVQSPGAAERQLEVTAKVRQRKLIGDRTFHQATLEDEDYDEQFRHSHRFVEMGDDLLIWKMSQFNLSKIGVDKYMNKARGKKALILDLRGNGGGYESTMLRMVGNFFDRDITVGEVKRRKETKPLIAKSRGGDVFKGELVVLVDSESGSAAEIFARVVQLEKRGTVIGDRTAGAVMRSRIHPQQVGNTTAIFYAVSITDADVIMTDGKSLEHTGVIPDKLLLPSGTNLAASRDPVLPYAAKLVGVTLDAGRAGTLFPVEWFEERY